MKHIKSYPLLEAGNILTKQQIDFLSMNTIGTYSINPLTGLVDIEGNFDCSSKKLTSFYGIRFGKVSGSFYFSYNQLTSLAGAPQEVGGGFSCRYNQLTSLIGAPQEVGGGFSCSYNQLTSLAGAPQEVGEGFSCDYNQLTSLEGAPREIGGGFYCDSNQLTSLAGAPREIGGGFYCNNNQLTSLAGAPQEVGEGFSCGYNPISQVSLLLIWNNIKLYKNYQIALLVSYKELSQEDKNIIKKDLKEPQEIILDLLSSGKILDYSKLLSMFPEVRLTPIELEKTIRLTKAFRLLSRK